MMKKSKGYRGGGAVKKSKGYRKGGAVRKNLKDQEEAEKNKIRFGEI